MKNILTYLTKGSKLIIVYLLTVLVAGSILTYLSINNISNFKELTEKRITEEEKIIIENYRLQFQSTLEKIVVNLNRNNRIDSLLFNENGVLISPHFIENTFNSYNKTTTSLFKKKFQQAEQFEFIQKDFKTAEKQYLSSLRFTSNKSDSAKVYNAVSRICVKSGEQKRVLDLCESIIKKFNDTSNEFGFPYAYFSANQILMLSDEKLNIEIDNLLVVFLNGLVNNKTPYNSSTGDLLVTIQNRGPKIQNKETQENVSSLCQTINRRIIDIRDYKNTIQKIIKKEKTETFLQLNYFLVIDNKNNNNEILLLNQSDEYSRGYTISLKNIDSIVLKNLNRTSSKFEYKIQLADEGVNGPFFDKEYFIQNTFSPFFNRKVIQVELKHPKTVEEYIFKRKITTAIGLFLLFGAMLIGLYMLIQDEKRKKHMTRLRADFVSNVTHELKTPLTSINMFAESILLGRVESEKDLIKYSKVIVKESERLKRMINNILDFSRKENDKLTYHLKECDLFDIVNATMGEMNYWLEINKFEVTLDIQNNIMAIVDPEGIKQVLSNLISNAIKYSETCKKLTVRLYKKGKKAFIEIEDQGIGIPKEKQKNIFEKFYRVNAKKNENISGTGLGLTVSKDIIEAQNGKLMVSSIINKGSTFTIELNI